MNSTQERLQFSERLHQALRQAEYSPDSPTQLAREFNVRFTGHPVTVHAARKWLQGESIPTQEKLRALASWLAVPADWLRFGTDGDSPNENSSSDKPGPMSSRNAKMIASLQQLDEHHLQLAHEFLRMLLRVSQKK